MLKSNEVKLPRLIEDTYGHRISKYDAYSLIVSILEPETEITVEEVEANRKPYIDVLRKSYEKDEFKTIAFLMEKDAIGLNNMYHRLKGVALDNGMKEGNPENVDKIIKNWENVNKKIKIAYGIILDEKHPRSDVITEEKELTVVQMLRKHMKSLRDSKPKS
jgi:hypothetical protein